LARSLLARHLDADSLGQILDRVDEAEIVVLHQEAERVAVLAAAEAVIEVLLGDDRERGRLLSVEGATGFVFPAVLFQRHAAADQLDQVDPSDQLFDGMFGDETRHGCGCRPSSQGEEYTAAVGARPLTKVGGGSDGWNEPAAGINRLNLSDRVSA